MDNDFKSSIGGIELAKQLHENDYISLYLFSGKDFVDGDVPDYLTVILKTDTDNLLSFVG
ncbi:MAG TPA: hypothetical protein DCZ38_00025 [Coxiellaceae bacterium]|nr:hypothetical protein [Coxiellaceae bacterium]